ncbi:unnamed protein product [Cochlearia groenlandica]
MFHKFVKLVQRSLRHLYVKKRPRLCPDTLVHQGKDLACDQRQRHKFSLVTVGMLPLEIQNTRKTKEGSRRKALLWNLNLASATNLSRRSGILGARAFSVLGIFRRSGILGARAFSAPGYKFSILGILFGYESSIPGILDTLSR